MAAAVRSYAPPTQRESVMLSGGTTIDLARAPNIDDATWMEMKQFLASNPEQAKKLQEFTQNPEAMKQYLQTYAIAEYYQTQLGLGQNGGSSMETPLKQRLKALEHDRELAHVFEDVKKNGMNAMMKYYQDDELMLKISAKMGGLPQEVKPALGEISEKPLTLHEAAMVGDLRAVKEFLASKQPLDAQDQKGITALGYAIGGNRFEVVQLLLHSRANQFAVDASGNSALHYAAGYGRKEIAEYLIQAGGSVNQSNSKGQTPMAVASSNGDAVSKLAIMDLLRSQGAQ